MVVWSWGQRRDVSCQRPLGQKVIDADDDMQKAAVGVGGLQEARKAEKVP